MSVTKTDLLPELSEEGKKGYRNPARVSADLQEDRAAPLEHTTLDDAEYVAIATEETTEAQRAKWQRELVDQEKEVRRLRNLRTSKGYDGG